MKGIYRYICYLIQCFKSYCLSSQGCLKFYVPSGIADFPLSSKRMHDSGVIVKSARVKTVISYKWLKAST